MNRDKLKVLYEKYNLTKDDVYNHEHYLIITRQGIDKIQAIEKLNISYKVVKCEPNFAAVQAFAKKDNAKIETFGSALYGGKEKNEQGKWIAIGSTTSRYILEMAEKRAMSRAVLKLTGFYELGAFGEDESEDFKQDNKTYDISQEVKDKIKTVKNIDELELLWEYYIDLQGNKEFIKLISDYKKQLNK